MPFTDADELVDVLTLTATSGQTMGVVRSYAQTRQFYAHVKVLTAIDIMRLNLQGADITHRLWCAADPGINNTHRLRVRGDILRPKGPAVNLHLLDEVWLVEAVLLTVDNEAIEVIS